MFTIIDGSISSAKVYCPLPSKHLLDVMLGKADMQMPTMDYIEPTILPALLFDGSPTAATTTEPTSTTGNAENQLHN